MKILIYSSLFAPSIGGLETAMELLARGFVSSGHDVIVITDTPFNETTQNFPFKIERRPSLLKIFKLLRWSDVSVHGCISLKGIFPFFLNRKPIFVTHQTWYRRTTGFISIRDRAKLFLTYFTHNIAISSAIASSLPAPSTIIPNPYNSELFRDRVEIQRDKDLLFVGRLVSDKGCDVLISALKKVHQAGCKVSLTVVGEGPEKASLLQLVHTLKLDESIYFSGALRGEALAKCYNEHAISIIPSRWDEPFGIVALESIASGCCVISSNRGGLPEAVGGCGVLFPNSDEDALATAIVNLVSNREKIASLCNNAPKHLSQFRPQEIADRYLSIIEKNLR